MPKRKFRIKYWKNNWHICLLTLAKRDGILFGFELNTYVHFVSWQEALAFVLGECKKGKASKYFWDVGFARDIQSRFLYSFPKISQTQAEKLESIYAEKTP